jgi:hypothetical protein
LGPSRIRVSEGKPKKFFKKTVAIVSSFRHFRPELLLVVSAIYVVSTRFPEFSIVSLASRLSHPLHWLLLDAVKEELNRFPVGLCMTLGVSFDLVSLASFAQITSGG